MSYSKPPPARLTISDQIRSLKPGHDMLLPKANLASVRSLICRVKKGKRRMRYVCATDIDGVWVWRLA